MGASFVYGSTWFLWGQFFYIKCMNKKYYLVGTTVLIVPNMHPSLIRGVLPIHNENTFSLYIMHNKNTIHWAWRMGP